MKSAATDIADRLALLNIRYAVAFCTIATPPDPAYKAIAESLIDGLREGDEQAVARVKATIDPADFANSAFWSSSLGRLLFAAGGFHLDNLTQALAASVLDCSRQWVHELAMAGKLGRNSTGLVDAAGVRALLKQRIDPPVK